jgi:hypothetical protein
MCAVMGYVDVVVLKNRSDASIYIYIYIYIVTHMPIARQWFGKHIPKEYALNNR